MQVTQSITKFFTVSVVMLVLALSTACGSRGDKEPAASAEPSLRDGGKSVGSLSIVLDEAMPENHVNTAEDLDLINSLSEQIEKNIDVGSGSLKVVAVITKIKLKNNITAATAGLFAGPDIIAADVTVTENNAVVKTYTSVSTTTRGGRRNGRLARLLRDLGKKIARNI